MTVERAFAAALLFGAILMGVLFYTLNVFSHP